MTQPLSLSVEFVLERRLLQKRPVLHRNATSGLLRFTLITWHLVFPDVVEVQTSFSADDLLQA
jgi:hypothetical protein